MISQTAYSVYAVYFLSNVLYNCVPAVDNYVDYLQTEFDGLVL